MNALSPIEQRMVAFYDDELTAVLVEMNGRKVIYVPVRPICDYLGVNWDGQRQRLRRDPVLSEVSMSAVITTVDIDSSSRRPHTSNMLCLPLNFINGFLFGISASRVNPEVKERLIRYQRECYQILADAFLSSPETAVSTSEANLIQIREMGRAIMKMADEQLQTTRRLNKAAIIVGQHGRRITAIERQLSPRNAVTTAQAADISEKVKAVAMALTEVHPDKNHFQAIFAELHRRYRVSSYKDIRQDQYQPVLDFLDEWLEKTLG